MQIFQFARGGTSIYRHVRARVLLVGQMGWVGLAQNAKRAALNIFRNKMFPRNLSVQNRAKEISANGRLSN
jgi:hypothetical protein